MAKYRIVTPEQVVFHYETAGFVSRAMAWALDQVFVNILRIVAFYSLSKAGEFGIAFLILVFFFIDFCYFMFFELYWAGQSPGKRHMGIRVIAASGGKLGFNETFIRNLVRNIDGLPMAMTVGGVVALLDPYGRRLGDLAAYTLVARDVRQPTPSESAITAGRVNIYQDDPAIRNRILSRTSREERDFIFDLTFRRDQLDTEAREELFRRTFSLLKAKYNLPEGAEYLSDEQATLNVALTLEAARMG